MSSKNIWKTIENHRKLLEEFAKQNGIKTPQDWGKINLEYLRSQQYSYILNIYGGSLFKALKTIFPGCIYQNLF